MSPEEVYGLRWRDIDLAAAGATSRVWEFQPVISVEREPVSKLVPDKVMDNMRSCGAAIIHVDADHEVMTKDGDTEIILNSNVLIEIGAAMALYRRRFILLVRDGFRLPSNLPNIYEVRYTGESSQTEPAVKSVSTAATGSA